MVRNVFDHPVCASEVASQLFLIAQPPLLWRRGLAAVLRFQLYAETRNKPLGLLRVFVEPIDAGLYFFAPPLAAFPVTLSLNMR